MRPLIHLAARLYPRSWRERYGAEFDAFLDDLTPSGRDLCNVLGLALAARGKALLSGGPILATAGVPVRFPTAISVAAHLFVISYAIFASLTPVAFQPIHLQRVPPPPPPPAPVDLTDPRVFSQLGALYSSLPLPLSSRGATLPTQVLEGIGIHYLPLAEGSVSGPGRRRVFSGEDLEDHIVRRALPRFPSGMGTREPVSVFLEYLIGIDGSVKVLRTVGPDRFVRVCRLALEEWRYQPVKAGDRAIEAVTRVEVRFDSRLARLPR